MPRPDGSFARKDELNIYFQIYNPAVDTATGRPKLDIVYAFRRRDETMKYVDVGDYRVKESAGQVQGYAVPLEKWPAGTYRVVVTVTDTIASASKSAGAEFIIRE